MLLAEHPAPTKAFYELLEVALRKRGSWAPAANSPDLSLLGCSESGRSGTGRRGSLGMENLEAWEAGCSLSRRASPPPRAGMSEWEMPCPGELRFSGCSFPQLGGLSPSSRTPPAPRGRGGPVSGAGEGGRSGGGCRRSPPGLPGTQCRRRLRRGGRAAPGGARGRWREGDRAEKARTYSEGSRLFLSMADDIGRAGSFVACRWWALPPPPPQRLSARGALSPAALPRRPAMTFTGFPPAAPRHRERHTQGLGLRSGPARPPRPRTAPPAPLTSHPRRAPPAPRTAGPLPRRAGGGGRGRHRGSSAPGAQRLRAGSSAHAPRPGGSAESGGSRIPGIIITPWLSPGSLVSFPFS